MKLADKPCYPIHYKDDYGNESIEAGLTFRERLIIALTSNPAMTEGMPQNTLAMLIIQTADAIIAEMEK